MGKENYCPVCRAELQQVFLTDEKTSFKRLFERKRSFLGDRRGIFYKHKEIQTNSKKLLQHHCQFCPDRPPERYFDRLRDHMKKEHSKFFCDICVAHLQKFSWEFKVYSRPDLARHRRIGDEDDKSHKGHPRCEFCDERFLDNDELHIHLRKNHFWCHICERDGSQDYYANYPNLREHFRDFHFLCEEGDCIHEKFTTVFRSKVDLQAHRVGKHATSLTKAQARQARQLDVDISFAPHPRFQGNQRSVITGHDYAEVKTSEEKKGKKEKSGNRRGTSTQNRNEILDVETAMALSLTDSKDCPQLPSPSTMPQEPKKHKVEESSYAAELPAHEMYSVAHFPSLSGSQDVTNKVGPRTNAKPHNNSCQSDNLASFKSVDDFPTLGASTQLPKQMQSMPPPGFEAAASQPPVLAVSQCAKPPPGFETTGGASIKENMAPKDKLAAPEAETKLPSNNQERNQILVENIRTLLGHDKVKFDEFKAMSGKFRKGACSAKEYYVNCCDIFGKSFQSVFHELVELLPDKERQRELLSVHSQDSKVLSSQEGNKNKAGKSRKKAPPSGVWQKRGTVWSEGMQDSCVSETDFPSLPAASKRAYNQPSYRPTKGATVLKQAWIRGK